MDTKSRNIKYSYAFKISAFLAAILLVFAGAWNAANVTRMLYDYGWDNIMVREKPIFTDSSQFQSSVGKCMQNLAAQMSWEAYAEKYGYNHSLEEEQALALEEFAQYKKDVLNTAVRTYGYATDASVTDENGESVYDYTDAAVIIAENTDERQLSDAAQNYLNRTDFSFQLRGFSETVKVPYTATEQELLQKVEESYSQQMASAKRTYESEIIHAAQEVAALKNFSYLLVNETAGEAVTNMENVKSGEDFLNAVKEEDWYFAYTVQQGLMKHSDSVSRDSIYGYTYNHRGIAYIDGKRFSEFLDENFCNKGIDVYVCVPANLQAGDLFQTGAAEFSSDMQTVRAQILCTAVFAAIACVLSLYLVLVTGRVRSTEHVKLSPLDKIPPDIYTVICWGAGFLCLVLASVCMQDLLYGMTQTYLVRRVLLSQTGVATAFVLLYMFLMAWITEIAKYVKSKTPYFKSMLIYRLCKWILSKGNTVIEKIRNIGKRLYASYIHSLRHITKKSALFMFGYVAVNFLCAMFIALEAAAAFFLLVMIVVNVIAAAMLWKHLTALDKIMDAAEQSKNGEMPQDIGAYAMPEPLKTLAQNLSFTQEEMQKAVAEGIKGERMKTELITNVSHDLKTPLTSIISYVDLLKKCDILDTDAQKYITVLDEKSNRLKRLIEDLVEASKASSGAVTLNKMQVNLYELAVQAVGELEDGFEANGLQVVLNPAETAPIVFVDSQKTWRIIDNLLNNARKYSLSGSRVYVDITEQDGFGQFVIKNISGEALNIDPDELTQRFVRGDSSRTKEGSGLGLSIAKDLCNLQGGSLKIEIDGDLFKATVSLPKAGGVQIQTPNA